MAANPKTRRPPLDPATERAVRAFLERVSAEFDVTGAILYGSRARGTHRFDSDADLAVLLRGERKQSWPRYSQRCIKSGPDPRLKVEPSSGTFGRQWGERLRSVRWIGGFLVPVESLDRWLDRPAGRGLDAGFWPQLTRCRPPRPTAGQRHRHPA